MSPYRTIFLLLIISLLYSSCSTTKGLRKQTNQSNISLQNFKVLDNDYESLLFKSRIKLYKKNYSGLFLIKKMATDSSTHVVFLSEIGLNILDLKYRNDEFEVVSVKDFLNRPRILKTIQNDFRMIVQNLDAIDDYTIKKKDSDASWVLKFKHNSQRYSYFYKSDSGLYKICYKSGLFKTLSTLSGEEKMLIEISHKGIKLDITLEELEREKDHAEH